MLLKNCTEWPLGEPWETPFTVYRTELAVLLKI